MPIFVLQRKLHLLIGAALFSVFCASAVLSPSVAAAQQEDEEYARELFAEGHAHFDEGEYDAAIEKFLEVYEILDAPALLYNIGEAYRRADKLAEAEQYYQDYINAAPDAPNADDVVERIIDIQQKRAARKASLDISTDPSGAEIFIDDDEEARCQTPCRIDLDPGPYTVRADLDGHHSFNEDLALEAREDRVLETRLEPETAMGRLFVTTDVDDDVTLVVEGQRHSLPLFDGIEVEAKSQTISLLWAGDRVDHSIDVEANEDLHLFVPIGAAGAELTFLQGAAIGFGGTSLALAGAGIIAGMQASSTNDYLAEYEQVHGEEDTNVAIVGERQTQLRNNLLLGAAATLTIGAGLWAFDMFRSDDSTDLEPTLDDNSSGFDSSR